MAIQQSPRRSVSLKIMLRPIAAHMISLELKHKAMLASRRIRASAYVVVNCYTSFRAEKRRSSAPPTAVNNGGTTTRNRSHGKRYTPSLAHAAGTYSRPTVMPPASIAATAAMSRLASEVVSRLTEIQFQAEKRYQVALAMAKALLEKGLLTQEEYAVIDTILLDKFQPALGTLLSKNALT